MLDSKPVSTLLAVGTSLTAKGGTASINATMYRQVVGGLQHLWMTRPHMSFAVNKPSQFMHTSSEHHWEVVKRLIRYLNGTRSLGIRLLVDTPLTLHGFSDADWVGKPDDRTSKDAFLIFLGANPISWSFTKQHTVARSSIEAEYCAIAATVGELQWVKSLLTELLAPVYLPPTLFSDNLGAIYLSANPVFHSCMKHLVIDYHFVHDLVQSSELRVVYVSVGDQLADTLTKSLFGSHIFYLCHTIGVISGTPS